MLRSSVLSMVTALFIVVGCASQKPANTPDSLTSDAGNNTGLSLELRGDSDSGTAGGLQTVYFAFDSSTLGTEAKDTLKANAEFLKANTTVDIQVEGHADERGGIQYNLALGERRAKSVRDYLVALGVAKTRISVVSYGKEKPAAFGHDETAWSRNRRGNFVVTAK